jgi:hypothetical protein
MIVVIILLVIQITTFKPQKFDNLMYDRDMCPDYWKAVPAEQAEMEAGSKDDTTEQSLKKIKCVPDPDVFALDYKWSTSGKFEKITTTPSSDGTTKNVFGHSVINTGATYDAKNNNYRVVVPADGDTLSSTLSNVAFNMYGNVGIGSTAPAQALVCNMVFPALMAKEDEMYNPEKPNELRCKYAELCGINWSSVC